MSMTCPECGYTADTPSGFDPACNVCKSRVDNRKNARLIPHRGTQVLVCEHCLPQLESTPLDVLLNPAPKETTSDEPAGTPLD